MNLVIGEEFDGQVGVLAGTREKLARLDAQVVQRKQATAKANAEPMHAGKQPTTLSHRT